MYLKRCYDTREFQRSNLLQKGHEEQQYPEQDLPESRGQVKVRQGHAR